MDFILSEEQSILKSTANRFCADLAESAGKAGSKSTPAARWAQFAELGLLGLPFSEDVGGTGGGAVETMLVAEEMGRSLLTDAFVPAIAVAGRLIAEAGTAATKADFLPKIVAGERIVIPAFEEPGNRYDLTRVAAKVAGSGASVKLTGRKAVVQGATQASHLLVTARVSGNPGDRTGIALFLVDAKAAGVALRAYESLDGRSMAEVALDNAPAVGGAFDLVDKEVMPVLELAVDRGVAAMCAESVGAMEAVCDLTAEYLRTRKQFGAPIGKFQALQHRLVDMRIAMEHARSIAAAAAMAADLEDVKERQQIVAAAKVFCNRGGRYVGQQAIQLHGAMGMTDEYPAGRYLKRLMVLASLFGDADHYLDRFIAAA